MWNDEQPPRGAFQVALTRAIPMGIWTGIVIFVLGMATFFLVAGDGTAPLVTHVMLFVLQVPQKILGTEVDTVLIVGPVFWGVVVAAVVFGLELRKLRNSSE